MAQGLYSIVLIVVIRILNRMLGAERSFHQSVTIIFSIATKSRQIARCGTPPIMDGTHLKLPPVAIRRVRILLGQTLYGMENTPKEYLAGFLPAPTIYSALSKIKDQEHLPNPIIIGVESSSRTTKAPSLQGYADIKSALNPMPSFSIIMSPLIKRLLYFRFSLHSN